MIESAESGGGKNVFISESEDFASKLIGLLECTLTPILENISFEFDKNIIKEIIPSINEL